MNNKQSILLFTIFGTGHNLVHVNIILRALIREKANIDLALPESCCNTEAFATYIEPFLSQVNIIKHQHSNVGHAFRNSWNECKTFSNAINSNQQHYDAIWAINCSQIPFFWPIFRLCHYRKLAKQSNIKFGMISSGLDHSGNTLKTRVNNLVRTALLSLHKKAALKTIDNCAYAQLQTHSKLLSNKYSLVPDPMDKLDFESKTSSRAYLNIPEEAFVVSISGSISSHPRKNCHLLIEAISNPKINKNVCLLIAGKLGQDVKDILANSQEVKDKRIFVIDRYLSDKELIAVTCASDLVCTPYRDHYCPSGIVLRAFKCNVPVLVPNYHWFKFMVDNFNIGWTMESISIVDIVKSLNEISETNKSLPHSSDQRELLLRYFDEDNFAAHWLTDLGKDTAYQFEHLKRDYLLTTK